jgi:hypothetical protein
VYKARRGHFSEIRKRGDSKPLVLKTSRHQAVEINLLTSSFRTLGISNPELYNRSVNQ